MKTVYQYNSSLDHTSNDLSFVKKQSLAYNKGFAKKEVDLFCKAEKNANYNQEKSENDIQGSGKYVLNFYSNTFKTKEEIREAFIQYLENKLFTKGE